MCSFLEQNHGICEWELSLYAALMPNVFYLELDDESQSSKHIFKKEDWSVHFEARVPVYNWDSLEYPRLSRGTQNLQNKINLRQFYLKTYK